jgi:Acyl-CoA dehydrogenases
LPSGGQIPRAPHCTDGRARFLCSAIKRARLRGLSYTAYGLIMQELERADSGLRSLASVQGPLTIHAIHAFGTPEQQERWLPGLVTGARVGCFALTEHGHGSDPGGMETRARLEGDHYILNGSKCWIGNASIADVKVVWAKDDDGKVGGFVVEKDAPGFRANDIEGKFSLRMSRTSECWFENCRIPVANRLPNASGLRAPLSCLSQARVGIAWGVIGAAIDCYETALCLHQVARTIRSSDRRVPIGAGKTGLDSAGNYQGSIACFAPHANDGSGSGSSGANFARQTQQRLDGIGMRP